MSFLLDRLTAVRAKPEKKMPPSAHISNFWQAIKNFPKCLCGQTPAPRPKKKSGQNCSTSLRNFPKSLTPPFLPCNYHKTIIPKSRPASCRSGQENTGYSITPIFSRITRKKFTGKAGQKPRHPAPRKPLPAINRGEQVVISPPKSRATFKPTVIRCGHFFKKI